MRRGLPWLALVALAVLPYLRAIHSPLLYDDRTMLDNRWLAREAGPVSVFQHDYWYGTRHERSYVYRPLSILSLAWNLRAAPSREGIRAVNFGLHAAVTLALAWMLGTLLDRKKGTVPKERGQSPPETGQSPAAWLGAALFAVHPLGSEAVLWAVGRAEILAALFGIVAFTLYVRVVRLPVGSTWSLAFSVAAFFAALLSKESAVCWLLIGSAWAVMVRERAAPAKVWIVRACAYLGALAGFLILRGLALAGVQPTLPFVDNPLVAAGAATRMANAALLFGRYFGKMVWPQTLSIEYGFDQIPVVPLLPWASLGAIAIVGGAGAAVIVLLARGHRVAAFLAASVPCAFAVTGNLAFPIGTIFAERLAYLPLAALCGLAGLGIASIAMPLTARGVVAGVLLGVCALRTGARAGDYRDLATLSDATVAASPRAVKALVNAGRNRLRQGHAAEAIPYFERALALWPDYTRARELLDQARGTGIIDPSRQPPDENP